MWGQGVKSVQEEASVTVQQKEEDLWLTQILSQPQLQRKKSSAISNSFLLTSTYCPCATGVNPSEGAIRESRHRETVSVVAEQQQELKSWGAARRVRRSRKCPEKRGESPLGLTHRCVLSTSACGRRRPGAVLQTPAPSDALHGVAAKTRVHRHVPELEHRPPHHPIGHVEGGATGHPCTTAQMERPTSYILSLCCLKTFIKDHSYFFLRGFMHFNLLFEKKGKLLILGGVDKIKETPYCTVQELKMLTWSWEYYFSFLKKLSCV